MRVAITTLSTPEWGIPFPAEQQQRNLPLRVAPLPERVIVPLQQHTGSAAQALVGVGDRVLTGQPIGAIRENTLGARVHAPLSGTVTALERGPVPGRRPSLCVHIESDGQDTRWPEYSAMRRPLSLSTSALRHAVVEAGIVGLGGATFPAGLKLNRGSGVHTLILNAAECEPIISCDEALLNSDTDMMLLGAQVMLRILEADNCIIAIKQGMSAAIDATRAAIDRSNDDRFRIALVPPIYPVGGEAQLIKMLTGAEIPSGGLPWDSGAICQNVATAAAVARFLTTGEPLISRIITLVGGGIADPANFLTRIGTPISDLVAAAGGYKGDPAALIMGGPMMGVELTGDDLPVTKATNCVYVANPEQLAAKPQPVACIRCGDCSTACPADLMPQLLLQTLQTSDYERAKALGLPDCIECGCCDYVCPSHIPLTRGFVTAKQQLWQIGFEKRRADKAARRFSAREERLARQRDETAGTGMPLHDVSDRDSAKAELEELLKRVGAQDDAGKDNEEERQ